MIAGCLLYQLRLENTLSDHHVYKIKRTFDPTGMSVNKIIKNISEIIPENIVNRDILSNIVSSLPQGQTECPSTIQSDDKYTITQNITNAKKITPNVSMKNNDTKVNGEELPWDDDVEKCDARDFNIYLID